jgi:hypothetical protein
MRVRRASRPTTTGPVRKSHWNHRPGSGNHGRSARPAGTDDWMLGDLARSLRLTPEGQPARSTRPGPDWSAPR